ncbi:MAG: ATP-binding protein [Candidatus Accumulibacter sp.]|uniref:two-component system sensor histidine kinase NtrB n=1 Tax=Accumulibacter sp. TaxID=2053492 RepID=UPI002879345D|nr:ATP-binding protein [Accumulibacter sp.]MDS4016096.1 ATP-binding protein [Accumulibacter sp.]
MTEVRNSLGEVLPGKEDDEQPGGETPPLRQRLDRVLAMGAVSAGVVHDFNNLLVSISGFAALGRSLPATADTLPRLRSYFGEIEEAGQRARALVEQLAGLARGAPAPADLVSLAVLARELVGQLADSFAPGVSLVIAIDDDLPPPAIARAHVQRILHNLCRNAREAQVSPGSVVLSARVVRFVREEACTSCGQAFAGDFVRLAVSDQGPGIPLALRQRVFEPFFTTRHASGAIGLGLTAVHALAHLNGGHVQVVSPPVAGSELAVFLPRARAPVAGQ